jgi:hypothetical protein
VNPVDASEEIGVGEVEGFALQQFEKLIHLVNRLRCRGRRTRRCEERVRGGEPLRGGGDVRRRGASTWHVRSKGANSGRHIGTVAADEGARSCQHCGDVAEQGKTETHVLADTGR